MMPRPPRSTLFPSTTLFRSRVADDRHREGPLLLLGLLALPQGVVQVPGDDVQVAGLDPLLGPGRVDLHAQDRKSTRLNSSHANISYAVFCLKKKSLFLYLVS